MPCPGTEQRLRRYREGRWAVNRGRGLEEQPIVIAVVASNVMQRLCTPVRAAILPVDEDSSLRHAHECLLAVLVRALPDLTPKSAPRNTSDNQSLVSAQMVMRQRELAFLISDQDVPGTWGRPRSSLNLLHLLAR